MRMLPYAWLLVCSFFMTLSSVIGSYVASREANTQIYTFQFQRDQDIEGEESDIQENDILEFDAISVVAPYDEYFQFLGNVNENGKQRILFGDTQKSIFFEENYYIQQNYLVYDLKSNQTFFTINDKEHRSLILSFTPKEGLLMTNGFVITAEKVYIHISEKLYYTYTTSEYSLLHIGKLPFGSSSATCVKTSSYFQKPYSITSDFNSVLVPISYSNPTSGIKSGYYHLNESGNLSTNCFESEVMRFGGKVIMKTFTQGKEQRIYGVWEMQEGLVFMAISGFGQSAFRLWQSQTVYVSDIFSSGELLYFPLVFEEKDKVILNFNGSNEQFQSIYKTARVDDIISASANGDKFYHMMKQSQKTVLNVMPGDSLGNQNLIRSSNVSLDVFQESFKFKVNNVSYIEVNQSVEPSEINNKTFISSFEKEIPQVYVYLPIMNIVVNTSDSYSEVSFNKTTILKANDFDCYNDTLEGYIMPEYGNLDGSSRNEVTLGGRGFSDTFDQNAVKVVYNSSLSSYYLPIFFNKLQCNYGGYTCTSEGLDCSLCYPTFMNIGNTGYFILGPDIIGVNRVLTYLTMILGTVLILRKKIPRETMLVFGVQYQFLGLYAAFVSGSYVVFFWMMGMFKFDLVFISFWLSILFPLLDLFMVHNQAYLYVSGIFLLITLVISVGICILFFIRGEESFWTRKDSNTRKIVFHFTKYNHYISIVMLVMIPVLCITFTRDFSLLILILVPISAITTVATFYHVKITLKQVLSAIVFGTKIEKGDDAALLENMRNSVAGLIFHPYQIFREILVVPLVTLSLILNGIESINNTLFIQATHIVIFTLILLLEILHSCIIFWEKPYKPSFLNKILFLNQMPILLLLIGGFIVVGFPNGNISVTFDPSNIKLLKQFIIVLSMPYSYIIVLCEYCLKYIWKNPSFGHLMQVLCRRRHREREDREGEEEGSEEEEKEKEERRQWELHPLINHRMSGF